MDKRFRNVKFDRCICSKARENKIYHIRNNFTAVDNNDIETILLLQD